MCNGISLHRKRIEHIIISIDGKNLLQDDEELSHWAKYICVLVSGFLEEALKNIYMEYCEKHSYSKVSKYTKHHLERVRNPDAGRFLDTTKKFDDEWYSELKKYIDKNGRSEVINAIATNRNQIAHGKDSDITISQVKEYFQKSVEVVTFLENLTLEKENT